MDYAKNIAATTDAMLGAKRKPLPVSEDDGELTVGDATIALTVSVYGTHLPRFKGDREQPDEPACFEIDDVTIGAGKGEVSIYAALGDDDLHAIAESVMESYE